MHTGWRGGWHNGRHGHFRNGVFFVDPFPWYGYGGYYDPYTDDSAYNAYCDPDSQYYDPDYCSSD
jgi:hypothetical protein